MDGGWHCCAWQAGGDELRVPEKRVCWVRHLLAGASALLSCTRACSTAICAVASCIATRSADTARQFPGKQCAPPARPVSWLLVRVRRCVSAVADHAPGRSFKYVTPRSRPDVSGSSRWPYTIWGRRAQPESRKLGNDLRSRDAPVPPAHLLRQCQRLVDALANDLHSTPSESDTSRRAVVGTAQPSRHLDFVGQRVVVDEAVRLQAAHGHRADGGGLKQLAAGRMATQHLHMC